MQMATSWPRNAVTSQAWYELHSLYMMNLANQVGWTEVGATPFASLWTGESEKCGLGSRHLGENNIIPRCYGILLLVQSSN